MLLSALLKQSHITILATNGSLEREVSGVSLDSRQVKPGHLFFAVKGTQADGHAYIPKALELGAIAVIGTEPVENIDPAPQRRRASATYKWPTARAQWVPSPQCSMATPHRSCTS